MELSTAPGLNVVLVEPEIPPNTGSIGRLCVATATRLHLVHPLGFSIDERSVKRAGLDYWQHLLLTEHASWSAFVEHLPPTAKLWFCTTKIGQVYHAVDFQAGDYLVFGRETKGLPEALLHANSETCITIPMRPEVRSLNLATSVGIVLFEAVRQIQVRGI